MSRRSDRELEILKRYFKYPWKDKDGYTWKSPYMAALVDARKVTARNIRSGNKLNREHGCWLGALGYMALVDHVGGVIKLNNKTLEENDFLSALKFFSNINEKERKTLYALRCSFAHNYHLYNNRTGDKDKKHHFLVTSGSRTVELIIPPKKEWNGEHETKNGNNRTIVNLELFGDLVEKMHRNISLLTKNGEIEIRNEILINTFIKY